MAAAAWQTLPCTGSGRHCMRLPPALLMFLMLCACVRPSLRVPADTNRHVRAAAAVQREVPPVPALPLRLPHRSHGPWMTWGQVIILRGEPSLTSAAREQTAPQLMRLSPPCVCLLSCLFRAA